MISDVINKWWWPAVGAAVAVAWVGVALAHSARYPALPAAAAAGTAVLAAAPLLPVARVSGMSGIVGLLVLPLAVAEAARGGNAAPLGVVLGVLVILAVVAGFRERERSVPLLALAAGVAGVVVGLTAGSADVDRIHLAIADRPSAAVILAGAVLVLAAIDERSHAERAVLAPVLLGALLAAPAMPPVAVILGWGVLAVGGAFVRRPMVALAATAVVAAAAGVLPAGLLLAAAAVLAAALDSRLAALCGLPGATVLAATLVGRPVTLVGTAAAIALAVTALTLAVRFEAGVRLDGGRPVALALGAWLILAPSTWSFSGAANLHAYDQGAARAVATGLLVALAVVFRRGGEFAVSRPEADGASSDDRTLALAVHPVVTATVATVATVASVGWLVVSVVRLH